MQEEFKAAKSGLEFLNYAFKIAVILRKIKKGKKN